MNTETKQEQVRQARWYVAGTGNHQGLVIDEATGSTIAVTYDNAHAPLIAAAPELLEACNAALHAIDVALCGTPGAHYFNAVKTALKKANATTIEDNLAINVTGIKEACEKARGMIAQAIAKATGA